MNNIINQTAEQINSTDSTIISDITVGAAGVTTLNVLPNDLNYNGIGTLVVTIFTCLMQYLKYREEMKRRNQQNNQPPSLK